MTLSDARFFLRAYYRNEADNAHAENFLLLAEAFKDEKAIEAATENLQLRTKKGFIEFGCAVNEKAYKLCNHYYYQLKKMVDGK